jgi:hypothetical protein
MSIATVRIASCRPIAGGEVCTPAFVIQAFGPTSVVYTPFLTGEVLAPTGTFVCVPAHDNVACAYPYISLGPAASYGGCPCNSVDEAA